MIFKFKDKKLRPSRPLEIESVHEIVYPVPGHCPACGATWTASPDHAELAKKAHQDTCPALHRQLIVIRGNVPSFTKLLKDGGKK